MATRDELLAAVRRRYVEGDRAEKTRILDEFVAITGYHRKHAMRLLQRGSPARPAGAARPSRRLYDDTVREALVVLWEASDRICGKRLKPLLPMLVESMERHGHIALDDEVRDASSHGSPTNSPWMCPVSIAPCRILLVASQVICLPKFLNRKLDTSSVSRGALMCSSTSLFGLL